MLEAAGFPEKTAEEPRYLSMHAKAHGSPRCLVVAVLGRALARILLPEGCSPREEAIVDREVAAACSAVFEQRAGR